MNDPADMEQTRELVYNKGTLDLTLATLEALECDTLLALLPKLQKVIAKKTRQQIQCDGTKIPIYMNGISVPTEIMLRICQWLDYDAIMQCRLVCRSFYSITTDPRVCYQIPDIAFQVGGRLFGSTVNLSQTLEIVGRYTNLCNWTIPNGLDFSGVSRADMNAIASALPNLRALEIEAGHATITRDHVSDLLASLTSLRSLTVDVANVPSDIANLTHLILSDEKFDILPVLHSKSLRLLQYCGCMEIFHCTVDEFIRNVPNVETLICESQCMYAESIVSASLKSLGVGFMCVVDALVGCPALTDLQYDQLDCEDADVSVLSESIKNLTGSSQDELEDVDLRLFPNVDSYFVSTLIAPLHSESLKNLAMECQLRIPAGSVLKNLEWLSVREQVEEFCLPDTPVLHFPSCNWPRSLRSLRISFDANCKDSVKCTGFIVEALAGLPELRSLRMNAVLTRSLSSPNLVELEVGEFLYPEILCSTMSNCKNLSVVRWSNDDLREESHLCQSTGFWNRTMTLYPVDADTNLMIPRRFRGKMPASFNSLVADGRAAYFNPSERLRFGHFNHYAK